MNRRRFAVVAAAAAVGAGLASGAAEAAKKKPRRPAVVAATAPMGVQGTSGSGSNVQLVFMLFDARKRSSDVEVQFGVDRNGDGHVTEDEFRRATEDRLDERD